MDTHRCRRGSQLGAWLSIAVALLAGCNSSPPAQAPLRGTGTQSASPSRTRPNHAAVEAAVKKFFERSYAPGKDNVRAVLVTLDGRSVVQWYPRGTASETANVASVTKSVISTLIGIALSEGALHSLEQTLPQLLPRYAAIMKPDVATITLRQLLTMTAGLPADAPSGGADASVSGADWVHNILTRGVVQRPGTGFAYASGSSHLLAAILVQATGRSVLDYAREKLFDPLGINTTPAAQPIVNDDPAGRTQYETARFAWPTDPQHVNIGYTYLKLTAQDMTKLGNLFLNGGTWQGKRLVPAEWIQAATSPEVPTAGLLDRYGHHYGYQWWITTVNDHPAYAAIGYGGQIIEVVPALHLVVAASTLTTDDASQMDATTFEVLVSTIIVPAVETGR
jgi:CubicO group peptidase (beta-lactamase class C family)